MDDMNPTWDGVVLTFLHTDPVYYIWAWGERLRLSYLREMEEGGVVEDLGLYTRFQMSLRQSNNNFNEVNCWVETIPSEVLDICAYYPQDEFYIARVMALKPDIIPAIQQDTVLCLAWIQHCKAYDIPHEELFDVLDQGPVCIITKLGCPDKLIELAITTSRRIGKETAVWMYPLQAVNCLFNEKYLLFLSQRKTIERWDFGLIAQYSWLLDTPIKRYILDSTVEFTSLYHMLGIAKLDSKIRHRAMRLLRHPRPSDIKALSKAKDLKHFARLLVSRSKAKAFDK